MSLREDLTNDCYVIIQELDAPGELDAVDQAEPLNFALDILHAAMNVYAEKYGEKNLTLATRSKLYYAFAELVINRYELESEDAIPNSYGYTNPSCDGTAFDSVESVISYALGK